VTYNFFTRAFFRFISFINKFPTRTNCILTFKEICVYFFLCLLCVCLIFCLGNATNAFYDFLANSNPANCMPVPLVARNGGGWGTQLNEMNLT
jgi:hypothetical protein